MKKLLLLFGLVFLSAVATAQVQAHRTQCSYFMPFNWGFSYPGMFHAIIDPQAETMLVTPLSNKFTGIVSISVHESLDCGNVPACTYDFEVPVSGLVQLPEGFIDCALQSDPMFLHLCWWSRVVPHRLQRPFLDH